MAETLIKPNDPDRFQEPGFKARYDERMVTLHRRLDADLPTIDHGEYVIVIQNGLPVRCRKVDSRNL